VKCIYSLTYVHVSYNFLHIYMHLPIPSLPECVCLCVALSQKRRYIGIALSVRLSISPSQKLITLAFLNISSSNFLIVLLMTTQWWWCQILQVKVTFGQVFPILLTCLLFCESIQGCHKCSTIYLSSMYLWPGNSEPHVVCKCEC